MVRHYSLLLRTRIRILNFYTITYFIACMMRTSHIHRTSTIRRHFLYPQGLTHKSSSTYQTLEVSRPTSRISKKSQHMKTSSRSQRSRSSLCRNNRLRHVLIGKVNLNSSILKGKRGTSICKDRWRGLKDRRLRHKQLPRWHQVRLSLLLRWMPALR